MIGLGCPWVSASNLKHPSPMRVGTSMLTQCAQGDGDAQPKSWRGCLWGVDPLNTGHSRGVGANERDRSTEGTEGRGRREGNPSQLGAHHSGDGGGCPRRSGGPTGRTGTSYVLLLLGTHQTPQHLSGGRCQSKGSEVPRRISAHSKAVPGTKRCNELGNSKPSTLACA